MFLTRWHALVDSLQSGSEHHTAVVPLAVHLSLPLFRVRNLWIDSVYQLSASIPTLPS